MYQSYWQLSRAPFEEDCTSQFFFKSDAHQAVLLKLRYLVESRKGLGLLAGVGGVGKSYLARVLTDQLSAEHGPFVHLVFPQLSAPEFLAYLAVELGAEPDRVGSDAGGADRTIREIQQLLVRAAEQNQHPVILVDEAHLIEDPAVFQALRLLLNLQTGSGAPCSLLFIGQPELLNQARRIGPLHERLAFSCVLRPLTEDETESYVSHRLEAAGTRKRMFTQNALATLFELSAGIPRRINRMCDLALLVGYADDATAIDAAQIEAVCEELTTAIAD